MRTLNDSSIRKLEQGNALGPTLDQDVFAYRSNVRVNRFPIPLVYKVEFGDFPGDDSREYIRNYGPWLHTTPFFKWLVESDCVIFAVDLAEYRKSRQVSGFVAELSAAIRAAWQHLVDYDAVRNEAANRRLVVLAFTKTDILTRPLPSRSDQLQKAIMKLGFGDKIPPPHEFDPEELEWEEAQVKNDFEDLIAYLTSEIDRFHVVFVSCFGTLGGQRLGIERLLRIVLPSGTTSDMVAGLRGVFAKSQPAADE
jgi:hypothetical protein